MTSTNYLTIAGSALPALDQTIEQKYKEGVSYIVTIEIERLASGIWVTVSRLENPPNSLFLDTMDFLTMGVVAIVLLRTNQESMEEAAAPADTVFAFVKMDEWSFDDEPITSSFFLY